MPFAPGIVDAIDPLRLRLLVEVERRGSISAAAEICQMSQPSATKHLQTLEAAVGEKLVERNGRASQLTEAGTIVARHASTALETLQGMEEELNALRDAERGTLALAASTTVGSYVLPSTLQCLTDRHPHVDVDIAIGPSAWVVEQVARREHSLGVAGEVELPAGVRSEPFMEDEVVGIAAPGEVRLRRGRARPSELEEKTLLVREPGSSTQAVAERHLARTGFHPAKRWELDSNEAIKRSVGAGLGIGFVSRLVVEDELERGELESFRLERSEPMSRSLLLLLPDDRDLRPSEQAFVRTLGDCCDATFESCAVAPA